MYFLVYIKHLTQIAVIFQNCLSVKRWTVNLTQLPSGTKHRGDTKRLYISMKFSMILFRFSNDYCLEKIPREYPTRQINFWIKRGSWSKWKITMLSGFLVLRKIPAFFHAMYLIRLSTWWEEMHEASTLGCRLTRLPILKGMKMIWAPKCNQGNNSRAPMEGRIYHWRYKKCKIWSGWSIHPSEVGPIGNFKVIKGKCNELKGVKLC